MAQHISPSVKESKNYELSQSQLMMWAGQELSPNAPIYNMALTFDFAGSIDEHHFQAAFQTLVDKTDALRTVFGKKEGFPYQRVLKELKYKMELLDWTDEKDIDLKIENWAERRTQTKFDLTKCLFDSVLIKVHDFRYLWFFNQHHLITDAWSVSILYKNLSHFYKESIEGKLNAVNSIPNFKDFIDYQKNIPNDNINRLAKNYWNKKINNLPKSIKMYGGKGGQFVSQSEQISIHLGKERTSRLKALTKESEIQSWTTHLSQFNIIATILFCYLYRVSGQKKIAIGSPAHNRPTNKFKETPGLFIELFPIMAEIQEEDSFISLLQKVKKESFEFLRYAQPGTVTPELSRSFNVVLNYIHASFSDFNKISMKPTWVHSGHCDPNHHLRVQVYDFIESGDIQINFDFNTSLFNESMREKAYGHFLKLLDHFLLDYSQNINACDILSIEERGQIIKNFNQTDFAFNKEKTLIELFEAQVERTPNNIAISFDEIKLTYESLNKRSNQLAHFLRRNGLKIGDVVGLCMERSIELLVAIYGVLKAGAAFLPIDPDYPYDRKRFMMNDSKVAVILSQIHLKNSVPDSDIKIWTLDKNLEQIEKENTDNPVSFVSSNDLAYINYTSGSTGRPKGVMIKHKGICNRLLWGMETYQLTEEDIVLQKTPFTFDVSTWEFFWPLFIGAQLVIANQNGHKDSAYLVRTIIEKEITVIHFVPSMLDLFLEEKGLENCVSLKRVFCSGEALTLPLRNRFFSLFNTELHNLYGPTEASVEVTYWQCDPNSGFNFIPIGKPVANTKIYILNPKMQPVPLGTSGELHIGGIQVAAGYLNRPELTEERFVPDPFDDSPGAKLYKSGDLARYYQDGTIEYLGRLDTQVKLRGLRIELGEVEAAINKIDEIRQVVVLLKGEGLSEKFLVAYFVATSDLNPSDLQKRLLQSLPHYMIPTYFIQLDSMPISLNGKIDRKYLPEPEKTRASITNRYIPPNNDIEELLASIWSKVLNIPQIGIYDNFFELGGHSLTAIRLVSRINEAFELNLPVVQIFKTPTIAFLAKHIEETILILLEE